MKIQSVSRPWHSSGTVPPLLRQIHRLHESYFFQLQRPFWIPSGVLEYVPDSSNWQKSY